MASSAADAAAPPSAADGVAYGHASATQCYPAGAGEAVHASRQYASMDGAPGMQMMGLAPDQLPHALAGHPYVYALPPGMMMVPMQPQDADGHHAEAGMSGGPVRREGMRPNASRRANYTVDFKRKVVRDALTRPLGNRIRPTCALYPHVEPCQRLLAVTSGRSRRGRSENPTNTYCISFTFSKSNWNSIELL